MPRQADNAAWPLQHCPPDGPTLQVGKSNENLLAPAGSHLRSIPVRARKRNSGGSLLPVRHKLRLILYRSNSDPSLPQRAISPATRAALARRSPGVLDRANESSLRWAQAASESSYSSMLLVHKQKTRPAREQAPLSLAN